MIDPQQIKRNILNDMRVSLTEEFDKNFQRKAFFTQRWKPRANKAANGSLLIVTGTLRRSIHSSVSTNGVRFTSDVPYAAVHNEGGTGFMTVRAHNRRTPSGKIAQVRAHQRKVNIPQRQFIGGGTQTSNIIKNVISDNLQQFNLQLTKLLQK